METTNENFGILDMDWEDIEADLWINNRERNLTPTDKLFGRVIATIGGYVRKII